MLKNGGKAIRIMIAVVLCKMQSVALRLQMQSLCQHLTMLCYHQRVDDAICRLRRSRNVGTRLVVACSYCLGFTLRSQQHRARRCLQECMRHVCLHPHQDERANVGSSNADV